MRFSDGNKEHDCATGSNYYIMSSFLRQTAETWRAAGQYIHDIVMIHYGTCQVLDFDHELLMLFF